MSNHSRIGNIDWRRDALFIVLSIVTIIITIVILLESGLAKARYEPPKYPFYLIISEFVFLAQISLIGVRLSIIFNRGMRFKINTADLIKVVAAQVYMSLLIPGFYIGGEVITITYLTYKGLPTARVTEGIVLRYTVDTITLTLMILIFYLFSLTTVPFIAFVMAVVLFVVYMVLFISIVSARLGRYIERMFRFISSRVNIARNFIVANENETYGVSFTAIDYLVLFILSATQWLLSGLNVTLIFYALGVNTNFIIGVLIMLSYTVLTYISLLPGSAGIGELANLYILNNLGLSNYYLAYDVWFRIITYIIPLIILMPLFLGITRRLTINISHRNLQ
ncbi:lysylphosphatidylglycerol synthase transmembrane domain-containing protein [Vulcanisaeta distributa]|uniref:lysylphosphatidylglycerol synthase transmembrane domain-containing protein n=1 Tax=Vulcanisaeta distributa TaxID=164451 RepID=UPI0006D17166|nr:lysylphosphatidylglycerol synthase transmembrane domain-containing protein [Vulcanisaeta distributa]